MAVRLWRLKWSTVFPIHRAYDEKTLRRDWAGLKLCPATRGGTCRCGLVETSFPGAPQCVAFAMPVDPHKRTRCDRQEYYEAAHGFGLYRKTSGSGWMYEVWTPTRTIHGWACNKHQMVKSIESIAGKVVDALAPVRISINSQRSEVVLRKGASKRVVPTHMQNWVSMYKAGVYELARPCRIFLVPEDDHMAKVLTCSEGATEQEDEEVRDLVRIAEGHALEVDCQVLWEDCHELKSKSQ